MPITETQAKEKWCPYTRVDGSNRLNNSRTDGFHREDHSYHCLASDCMAWREFVLTFAHGDVELEKHGYCGLAGRPSALD